MQRYHDVISSFGGKTSYDADNRPLLVMRSNLWASGYDVDGTDQTSLGQFSGRVQQTYKHSVPRFFVPVFFQAEDGIRDVAVTGVQTCALPIYAPESATAKRRGILALYIRKSFDDSDGTYGYRRVQVDLAAWGVPAGPELVRSLMRELGLEACQPRPWRVSLTEGDGQEHDIPDLVHRDFTADTPGQKMVGDITYISTWEGWLFLATVIDCHTKAVIGWAMDDNYKTPLIERAIEMAARNYPLAGNAIFHSDYAED